MSSTYGGPRENHCPAWRPTIMQSVHFGGHGCRYELGHKGKHKCDACDHEWSDA